MAAHPSLVSPFRLCVFPRFTGPNRHRIVVSTSLNWLIGGYEGILALDFWEGLTGRYAARAGCAPVLSCTPCVVRC